VVLNEAVLSVHTKETQTALSIARAGLRMYMGKQMGVEHDDIITYPLEGGDAVVTARRVAEVDGHETLYLLSSEGVYADPTFEGSPARRTVYQYVKKRGVVLDHMAALTQATGGVRLRSGTNTYGDDGASSGDCEQPQANLMSVLMGSGSLEIDKGANLNGTSESLTVGSKQAVLDSLNLDWDLITNPSFAVDYEDELPDYGTLPYDSFPTVRFNGSLTLDKNDEGWGLLIVKQTLTVEDGWWWDGMVLAGHLVTPNNQIWITGLAVAGLDGLGGYTDIRDKTEIKYHRCYAYKAGEKLSHFVPVGGTWWEGM